MIPGMRIARAARLARGTWWRKELKVSSIARIEGGDGASGRARTPKESASVPKIRSTEFLPAAGGPCLFRSPETVTQSTLARRFGAKGAGVHGAARLVLSVCHGFLPRGLPAALALVLAPAARLAHRRVGLGLGDHVLIALHKVDRGDLRRHPEGVHQQLRPGA